MSSLKLDKPIGMQHCPTMSLCCNTVSKAAKTAMLCKAAQQKLRAQMLDCHAYTDSLENSNVP